MNIEFLINKYHKLIYRICYNMLDNSLDAQDLTQEVYLLIYTSINKYGSCSENELKNIICKMTLNKCKDFLLQKENKILYDNSDDNELEGKYIDDKEIEINLLNTEKKAFIINQINALKEPYSLILYSHYIKEESLDSISANLHIPKPTLKMQLYRAKGLLKENLIKGGIKFYE